MNFDNVTPERAQAARHAKRLLGGPGYSATDIDHDIRGSLLAGHAEALPGFEGVYFNPGSDPSHPEFLDVHGKKVAGNQDWMSAYNAGGYANRPTSGLGSAGGANGDPSLPGGGGGIGGGGGGGGLYGSINDMLGQLMSGKMSRYGEDTTRRMKGQALEASKGQLNQNLSAINDEAARAGFSGSPQALALAAQQRSTATNQYSSLVRDIENQKAQADYEDKVQGLNMAMDQVEKDRQYRLGEARNQIERDRIEADTAIARERIQSESDMLDRQLAAQQAMAARSAAAGAAGQGRAQAFQREMATMQHGWQIENRDYMMPFNLAQLGLGG